MTLFLLTYAAEGDEAEHIFAEARVFGVFSTSDLARKAGLDHMMARREESLPDLTEGETLEDETWDMALPVDGWTIHSFERGNFEIASFELDRVLEYPKGLIL